MTPKVPKLDLVFAISASPSENNFGVIRDIVKEVTERFFSDMVQYGLIVFGKDATIRIAFQDRYQDPKKLQNYIGTITANNGEPALDKALVLAKTLFESESARRDAQKVRAIVSFSMKVKLLALKWLFLITKWPFLYLLINLYASLEEKPVKELRKGSPGSK